MTRQLLEAAWHETPACAGHAEMGAAAVFKDLCRRYSAPGRAYHNLDHIATMLDTVTDLGYMVHNDVAVRLALWFHDAVYDPRRADNEEQSATLAAAALARAGASLPLLSALERLILVTKTHQASPHDTDCQLLIDADLAILGASAADYDRYARAIREEYAWVPEPDYRTGRRRVLEQFLGRGRLYHTASLFNQREWAWRAHLRREIEGLA